MKRLLFFLFLYCTVPGMYASQEQSSSASFLANEVSLKVSLNDDNLKVLKILEACFVLYSIAQGEEKIALEKHVLQNIEIVRSRVNDICGENKQTLLMLAAMYECKPAVELLLNRCDAMREMIDREGKCAYDYARKYIDKNNMFWFEVQLRPSKDLKLMVSAKPVSAQSRRKTAKKAAKLKKQEEEAQQAKESKERFDKKRELEEKQAKEYEQSKLNEENQAKAIAHHNAKKRLPIFKKWHDMAMAKQKLDENNQAKAFNICKSRELKKGFDAWRKALLSKRERELQQKKANRMADFKRRLQACQNSLDSYKEFVLKQSSQSSDQKNAYAVDFAYANLRLSGLRFAQYFKVHQVQLDEQSSHMFKEIYEICTKKYGEYGQRITFDEWFSRHRDYVSTQKPNEHTLSLLDAVRAKDYQHAFAILNNKKIKLDQHKDLKEFYAHLRINSNKQHLLHDAAIFAPGMKEIIKQYVITDRATRARKDMDR